MSLLQEGKITYKETKRIIYEAMENEQLVLFVGAGASVDSGMPLWKEAISKIAEKMQLTDDQNDYLKVPQYYYNSRGKKEYTQLMRDIFKYEDCLLPTELQKTLLDLNTSTIITTNYDHLIEKAAEENGQFIRVVSQDVDMPYRKSKKELIKMHGDFEHDNFVLKVAAVPLFNILSVIMLTFGGRDNIHGADGIKTACINILKNPIIIGIVLGVPFSLLNIPIPAIPMKTINYIAQTATPIALIAIGAGFNTKAALEKMKPAVTAALMKLVVFPLIYMPIAVKLGFAPSELAAILIMTGSPSTVTCYIMAKNMNNDEVLSSNTIVLTTLFSSITITVWVYVLRVMGCI